MAKKYWTFLETDKYDIGLTGSIVYICDKEGKEKAVFKDLNYAYKGCVSPNQDLLVIKSTEGQMAIYSLDRVELIKKFRFSNVDGSQDDNFIFSPDGKLLFNIERQDSSLKTVLSIYNTQDFSLEKRLFEQDENIGINFIEYDEKSKNYFILGGRKNAQTEQINESCVCKLVNDNLEEIRSVDSFSAMLLYNAKNVQLAGYTQKSYEWAFILHGIPLNQLKQMDISLATLWKNNGKISF